MPTVDKLDYELTHEEMASLYWYAIQTAISEYWQHLTWKDLMQLYAIGLGMYIGIQEGLVQTSQLQSAFIGGGLGFFGRELTEDLAKAAKMRLHSYRASHSNHQRYDIEESLKLAIEAFEDIATTINPLLCQSIIKLIQIKTHQIKTPLLSVNQSCINHKEINARLSGIHRLLESNTECLRDPINKKDVNLLIKKIFKLWSSLSLEDIEQYDFDQQNLAEKEHHISKYTIT